MLIVYKSTFSPYYCRLSLEVGPSPLDQIIAVQISLLLTCFCYFAGSLGLFFNFVGSVGHRGSSLGQKRVFYGALRRSWDLPFHLELKKLSRLIFYGLAEVGGS